MNRWLGPMAVGGILALAALLGFALLSPSRPASQADAARSIAQELRCPDCEGLSVADSSSTAAAEIRSQIAEQLSQGRTPGQVRQSFVDRYGDWILLAPASPLLWIAPAVLLILGLALLAFWIIRRRAAAERRAATPVAGQVAAGEEVLRARVRDEAEALDA
jgi:cytochrome c-type biogenesis protein CcmH